MDCTEWRSVCVCESGCEALIPQLTNDISAVYIAQATYAQNSAYLYMHLLQYD